MGVALPPNDFLPHSGPAMHGLLRFQRCFDLHEFLVGLRAGKDNGVYRRLYQLNLGRLTSSAGAVGDLIEI